jgi:polyphosphate kinase 2 (PPK2 family)
LTAPSDAARRADSTMLENLDLDLRMEKSAYREAMPRLRERLRDAQLAVRAARIPVVVLFEGWGTSGKGDSIASLVYPLDPRGFKVYTTRAPNEEERFRPFLWRFSTRLPARGDFSFFDRSWYRRLLEDRLDGHFDKDGAPAVAAEIREFERSLTDDGFVVIKFWLHISKEEQQKRLAGIEADRYERWRLTQPDWRRHRGYKKYGAAAEEMLALTSTADAPWHLVEATDRHFRRVKVFETVLAALHRALERGRGGDPGSGAGRAPARAAEPLDPDLRRRAENVAAAGPPTILDRADLTKRLERADYEKRLEKLQARLRDLALECYRQRVPAAILYEGWDAAGKGGNIKRLTQELDPRGYEVIPVAAPDATEKGHHHLWRFWRQLPKAGHLAIFDRTWYGRVLVERVEGFASEAEWRRAYQEINDFERHLTEFGTVVVKFWLHVSPEEQLRRFREREATPYKNHKITPEDWRNRLKWLEYRGAVAEMIERTSTKAAPWTIVEAEDKLWARVKALSTVVAALEDRLGA